MVFSDLLRHLKQHGLNISEGQIRWAIRQGKISRPPLDGSLRFQFSEENLAELVTYFTDRPAVTTQGAAPCK